MSRVESAQTATIDGLVREGRASGMTTAQLRTAGQDLIGRLREAVTTNPLLAEYFPAAAEGLSSLARSIEIALTELTAAVPAGIAQQIDAAYEGVTGRDAYGLPIQIGPMLRRELVQLATAHQGDAASLDAALRTRILESAEVATSRQGLIEGRFDSVLGRASTLDERKTLATWIEGRLDAGANLQQINAELDQRLRQDGEWGQEFALMERVGATYGQVFYDHGPADAKTKQKWATWVKNAMSQYGMTEAQAFQYLPDAMTGKI